MKMGITTKQPLFNENLLDFFICPCCLKSPLCLQTKKSLICTDEGCYGFSHPFELINNQPVLIDFRNGVFERKNFQNSNNGEVIVRKKGKVSIAIKRILWGDSPVSKIQVEKLINAAQLLNRPIKLLVVGGGTIGLGTELLYTHPKIRVISFDVYVSGHTDFIADAHKIPIKDNSVDAVVVQAVLEHVLNPQKVVSEIYRVLKMDGLVYGETPFMQQVHEGAYDFSRFTESGHRWLFRDFKQIDSGAVRGAGVSLIWSIRYFFSGLFRSQAVGSIAAALFFWLRFLEILIPKQANIDGGSCFYFLGTKNKEPLSEREIVDFYKKK